MTLLGKLEFSDAEELHEEPVWFNGMMMRVMHNKSCMKNVDGL